MPTARPRKRTRRIRMLVFPGAHLLDISGPLSLFAAANDFAGYPAYDVGLIARRTGAVASSGGLQLVATQSTAGIDRNIDTLLIAGGEGIDAVLRERAIVAWLQQQARQCRRVASVCSGALLLAEAGLLDNRRATTHWQRCQRLAVDYPRVRVELDSIFVRDGKYATSAGISAGMDLALALIEEDFGPNLVQDLAREFVLYMRRSGGQAQFSPALRSQNPVPGKMVALQQWVLENLHLPLSVADLAARAAMSPRHFARRFAAESGMTPAAFVAAARVDAARQALAGGVEHIDRVADQLGFGSAERMRRSFRRHLAVTPSQFRQHFQKPEGETDAH